MLIEEFVLTQFLNRKKEKKLQFYTISLIYYLFDIIQSDTLVKFIEDNESMRESIWACRILYDDCSHDMIACACWMT